jgi:dihydrofolate reductase
MKISIVVAVAENNVIGRRNALPWYLPADLLHFKKITSGHHIVFGQTTHESIGRPLPQRVNIILSKDLNYKSPGCIVLHTPKEVINFAKKNNEEELMICGGAQVYKTFLPMTERIYITKVKEKIDGDIYFPEFNKEAWKVVSTETHKADKKNKYPTSF